ncbi:MAG TPA: hypothetical protein ENK29_04060 [Chromatiales bacterium]|nr:hypothetical protein [Chromatiales bacterium]
MISQEQMDELVCHNGRLVRAANDLRLMLRRAENAIGQVIDAAEPIARQHEDEPVEYAVPAEDIDELRAVLVVARAWDNG